MPQVAVTIAGRVYRIACADGEEKHLEGLAAFYDRKIEDMRSAVGEIGDMRLHVMAAIALADEMSEQKQRIAALEAELTDLRALASDQDGRVRQVETRFAEGIQMAAEKIERLARGLSAANPG